jgi:capsule polysaccharide export protein KpsE/RkpR
VNAPNEAPLSDQVGRAAMASRELRRRRLRRIAITSGIFVLLPTLLAVVYYGLLASRQYQSEAVLTLPNDPRGLDLVRQHMLSRAALSDLDRDHGLLSHYQDSDIDWWSRLSAGAGNEKAYDY